MSIQLHHISITCEKLKLCQKFYEKLGFKVCSHYKDEDISIVLLRSNNTHIELFNMSSKTTNVIKDPALKDLPAINKIGITHFALQVSNLYEIREKLINEYNCTDIKPARLGGFSYFFTQDPEGNQIEFLQEKIV